jgi:tetratricopeptide (TPR) repeat protein
LTARGHELSARFRLIRPLGAGGGGEVWLAQDRELGACVAVKILSPAVASDASALAALQDISARLNALADPHIVRVHGVFGQPGNAWLAMEYAAGGDLTVLRGRPCAEILGAVIPIAGALAQVHRAGIVHRDVKPANVVLTVDGTPQLTDFGAALLVSQYPTRHTAPGSLYTMSPESLEPGPTTPGTDVYAFGAMLYELVSGYPPFYPDISPERVRHEMPASLAMKYAVPPALQELIAWCLRKSPAARPASMEVVETQLRCALDQSSALRREDVRLEQSMSNETEAGARGAPESRADAPFVRPPSMPAEPLRSEWRRTTHSAPDPSEFRRQGFRRGLTVAAVALGAIAIFIVFFALPKWVGNTEPAQSRQAATPAPVAPKVEEPKKPIDYAALARAKQAAEDAREPLAERLDRLRERGADQWGADDHKRATDELAAGDTQLAAREYVLAVEHFQKVDPLLASLEARAGEVLKEQLALGAAAISEGRSADAKTAYDLALKLDAKNALATRGRARAETLDQVLALLTSAERQEQDGELTGAMNDFRQALALDKEAARATEGLSRVSARVAGDAFASAMARGFADLGSGNFAGARTAFESAGKIRPNASEVAAALKRVEQDERTQTIAGKLETARDNESKEQWADALKSYREVLALDSTVAAANEGVARVQPRSALNEQLEVYLTQPERLFSSPVRTAARETLQRAGAIQNPGPVLTQQVSKLREWLARADVPVQVAIQSDNLTQVTIFRIGQLGSFEQRSLELAPGEYTVLGTRPGYRDVRRQIMVVPGTALAPVVVRCEDKI